MKATISDDTFSVALFGAAPDTGNMGVSALYHSLLQAMGARLPNLTAVVFDNGLGERAGTQMVGGRPMSIVRFGARGGRRYHRPENLRVMSLLSRFRGGSAVNRGLALIDGCRAVMDVSGGDSFSDIYGAERFRNILLPKLIAARRGRPLLLLPQTYGPFREPVHRAQAREAVLAAGQAWSRDPHSHGILQDLLGADFDPQRHRTGVDMAFGLLPEPPPQQLQDELSDWLASGAPIVGINVSGLIWGRDSSSAAHFGFKADYRQLLRGLVRTVLAASDANVLLIPHVFGTDAGRMTDSDASRELVASLEPDVADRARIRVAPDIPNERQVKWLIARTHWFCGTRMHATIAALSTGVPTASVIYSDKALGVFDTCGQAGQIVDPRRLSTGECVERLRYLFDQREQTRQSLARELPPLRARLVTQMDDIARFAAGIAT